MKTNKERSRETKAELLAAVTKLIARRGLVELSFSDVAVEANRSRTLAVHHFKSRDQLLAAGIETLSITPPTSFEEDTLRKLVAEVERGVRTALAGDRRRRALHVVLGDVRQESPHREQAMSLWTVTQQGLQARLEALQKQGEIRSTVDCHAQAYAIAALVRGCGFLGYANNQGLALDAVASEIASSLLWSLNPPPRDRGQESSES
jgi:AcrR family transcriptional regulator